MLELLLEAVERRVQLVRDGEAHAWRVAAIDDRQEGQRVRIAAAVRLRLDPLLRARQQPLNYLGPSPLNCAQEFPVYSTG
jgi:hypothetical protein